MRDTVRGSLTARRVLPAAVDPVRTHAAHRSVACVHARSLRPSRGRRVSRAPRAGSRLARGLARRNRRHLSAVHFQSLHAPLVGRIHLATLRRGGFRSHTGTPERAAGARARSVGHAPRTFRVSRVRRRHVGHPRSHLAVRRCSCRPLGECCGPGERNAGRSRGRGGDPGGNGDSLGSRGGGVSKQRPPRLETQRIRPVGAASSQRAPMVGGGYAARLRATTRGRLEHRCSGSRDVTLSDGDACSHGAVRRCADGAANVAALCLVPHTLVLGRDLPSLAGDAGGRRLRPGLSRTGLRGDAARPRGSCGLRHRRRCDDRAVAPFAPDGRMATRRQRRVGVSSWGGRGLASRLDPCGAGLAARCRADVRALRRVSSSATPPVRRGPGRVPEGRGRETVGGGGPSGVRQGWPSAYPVRDVARCTAARSARNGPGIPRIPARATHGGAA